MGHQAAAYFVCAGLVSLPSNFRQSIRDSFKYIEILDDNLVGLTGKLKSITVGSFSQTQINRKKYIKLYTKSRFSHSCVNPRT